MIEAPAHGFHSLDVRRHIAKVRAARNVHLFDALARPQQFCLAQAVERVRVVEVLQSQVRGKRCSQVFFILGRLCCGRGRYTLESVMLACARGALLLEGTKAQPPTRAENARPTQRTSLDALLPEAAELPRLVGILLNWFGLSWQRPFRQRLYWRSNWRARIPEPSQQELCGRLLDRDQCF